MRSAIEIFEHHLEVFGAGDMAGILGDYTEESVMIYGDKTWYGLNGARDFFTMWLEDRLPAGSAFDLIDKVSSEDMVFISWTAESERYRFNFGTDTFVMRDDRIWRQTVATFHEAK